MDTSETGLEKIIVDWLVQHNGYEQESPHAFNKDFALVDGWVERFVTETQPEKVKQSIFHAYRYPKSAVQLKMARSI